MRILVTGANGHLGANIVRSLLRHGYEVLPFVRKSSDLRGIAALDLDYSYGDIRDGRSLLVAAQGCDVIVHTAAVYRYWAKDPEAIMQPAIEGTRNVLQAANQAAVKRLIYTSTVWTVGLSPDPNRPLTAEDWNKDTRNPYATAKTLAEKEAWRMAGQLDVPMISICPNGVLGRYNYQLTPSMIMFRDWLNGTQFTADTGFGLADVRDVAEIHALAVTGGEIGKRYIVSGENLNLKEMGQLIGSLTGNTPRHLPLGRAPAYLYASLVELAAKLTNSEPQVTRNMILETIGRYMFTNCEDTWHTFDYQPHSTEEMVTDAIRWLLYIGEIKADRAEVLKQKFPPDPDW